MNTIIAFFYTAQDARRALNALQGIGAEVEMPTRLSRPVNGRSWQVEVKVKAMAAAGPYASPIQNDQVMGIILRNNGTTSRG